MTLTLQTADLHLAVEPAFGARITSLTDKRTGRQWLVSGPCEGSRADDAPYLAPQARGWDECFPSIAKGSHSGWGQLRDHGALWGRPWHVSEAIDETCTCTYQSTQFTFERSLSLHLATVKATYRATNHGPTDLPYLWSQHALLATTPPDELHLVGLSTFTTGATQYLWPQHPTRNLGKVGPITEGFMQKSYAVAPACASAEIIGPKGGIRFEWSESLPAFGLWLDYGAWPPDNPVHQIAFEPTSAMADGLPEAERQGQLRILKPNETHHWHTTITLTP